MRDRCVSVLETPVQVLSLLRGRCVSVPETPVQVLRLLHGLMFKFPAQLLSVPQRLMLTFPATSIEEFKLPQILCDSKSECVAGMSRFHSRYPQSRALLC